MQSIALRIGIIAAIVIGGIILRPFLSGNAGNLQVGDCFDEPNDTSGIVEDVQHHPCTDAHDAEVVFVGNFEPAGDEYPSEEALTEYETNNCIAAFNAYTGIDFTTDELYGMGTLRPTFEGWDDGDREISCYAFLLDDTKLNQSIKKS